MRLERIILHSDLNNYYASVECLLHPELEGKAVAVCGDEAQRHGIVLAKSQQAKQFGIQTGMTLWQARRLCPELITIPPHFRHYIEYSRKVQQIYYRYTDLIESFGIDECWLDVTHSAHLFGGNGQSVAQHILKTVRQELGLTVSIGVSFNKAFAKLGSDLKKPNAISCIGKESYRQIIWPLPVECLLGVGRSTQNKLNRFCIHTIGQLAQADPTFLQGLLGVHGCVLWQEANGQSSSLVTPFGYSPPAKGMGHGITCPRDLLNQRETWPVFLGLCESVAYRLREAETCATSLQLGVKDTRLLTRDIQMPLDYPTQSAIELARAAYGLMARRYTWEYPVRALSVRATQLIPACQPLQLDFFCDQSARSKKLQAEQAVDALRLRYGNNVIQRAIFLKKDDLKLERLQEPHILPSFAGC